MLKFIHHPYFYRIFSSKITLWLSALSSIGFTILLYQTGELVYLFLCLIPIAVFIYSSYLKSNYRSSKRPNISIEITWSNGAINPNRFNYNLNGSIIESNFLFWDFMFKFKNESKNSIQKINLYLIRSNSKMVFYDRDSQLEIPQSTLDTINGRKVFVFDRGSFYKNDFLELTGKYAEGYPTGAIGVNSSAFQLPHGLNNFEFLTEYFNEFGERFFDKTYLSITGDFDKQELLNIPPEYAPLLPILS